MSAEEQEYLSDEVKKWKYMVELFSDRVGRVVINSSNVTHEYRAWSERNMGYAKAAFEAYRLREGIAK